MARPPQLFAGLFAVVWTCTVTAFHCPPVRFRENAVPVELADGRVFIPVYRHQPKKSKSVKTVVIGLHGAGRNGDNYFQWITGAMQNAGLQDDVAVLVPVFADYECTAASWTGKTKYTGDAVKWSHSTRQWVFGQKSDRQGDWHGISSYQVIDDVLRYAEMRYRRLSKIIVTGFSAGAQMGLRWSIFSPQGLSGTSITGVPMTIILGSPSSVTYLTPARPAVSCRGPDVTVDDNCTDFVEPDEAHYKTCHDHWDDYPFGIEGIGDGDMPPGSIRADVTEYLRQYIKHDSLLQQTLIERFASKDIVFQFGDTDTKKCGHGTCANDCAAMLEGNNRLQRGINYMWHLKWVLPGYEPTFSTFHGGHRPELFFAGEYFNKFAFNTDGWNECLWDSLSCFSLLVKALIAGSVVVAVLPAVCVYVMMHRHINNHYVRKTPQHDLEQSKPILGGRSS
uniref:Uncharacterized protein n=1 Tax=Pfiesteria piscicida TaxID=71001 RepID=A3E3M2_PFIPI|nr:hypothetical protein [Pfiesteria piscicida]